MSETNADQFLRVWELERILAGTWNRFPSSASASRSPRASCSLVDGRYLYGSSYFTGVSNIFRYEVSTGEVEAVSNAESGFFRPVPLVDGRLVVLTYTGDGFVPAIIEPRPVKDVSAITFLGAEVAAKHPIVTTWQVPPPSTVDYDKEIIRKGPYAPLQHLSLANAYPVLQGYKSSIGVGYHFNIEDSLGFARVDVTAAYTPTGSLSSEERGHLDINYSYLGWRAGLAWNRSDFYDLFGPTKRSRKGYSAKFGYDHLLIYDEPRRMELKFDLAYYDKIDRLPNAQNVETAFERLITGEIGLHYTDMRRSLGRWTTRRVGRGRRCSPEPRER